MDEFMTTSSGTTVSDADRPNYVVDLLRDIYEDIDEFGNVELTRFQQHDIKAVLQMVGILGKPVCKGCKGTGKSRMKTYGTRPEWGQEGPCTLCGGHGKLTYKRDAIAQVKA